MKNLYLLLSLTFLLATNNSYSQNDSIYFWKSGQLILQKSIKTEDLDSITFKRPAIVTICNQIWTTKNLEVVTYNDGTPIPQVANPTAWSNLTTGAWCYYNNDATIGNTYGKLYNWYAVAGIYDAASLADPTLRKNLAPVGWHMPSDAEWTELTDCLGGINVAGIPMTIGGTNSSGFTALPGGLRWGYGDFGNIGYIADFWTSTEDTDVIVTPDNIIPVAWYRSLSNGNGLVARDIQGKTLGNYVRCVKD